MHDLTQLTLRHPEGFVIAGATISAAIDSIRAGDGFFRSSLSWRSLAGPECGVSPENIHSVVRHWFPWKNLVLRAATALASLGFSYAATIRAQRKTLELALDDDWPFAIEQAPVLIAAARSTTTPAAAVTERGLLWLLTNALEEPWLSAPEELTGLVADRRFARLAMLASEMTTVPSHLLPACQTPATASTTALPTTAALLGDGRLAERDSMIRWLVRSVELYDDLLPLTLNGVREAFLLRRGVPLRTWIVKTVSLANLVEQEIAEQAKLHAEFDLEDVPPGQEDNPVLSVIAGLSATTPKFGELIRAARVRAADQTLAVEPFRRYPFLDLGSRRYVVLHKDFIAAAADDGVWYTLQDALGPRFATAFGRSFEQYVERILRRCALGPEHALVRIPESTRKGERRCDFAWRIGDDLFLIDAKRSGLNSAHLMGDPEALDRVQEQIGTAAEQILATREALESGDLSETLDHLGVSRSWRPRHTVPLVITHRPTYVFFSSPSTVLDRMNLTARWDRSFKAWPTVWALSDLELFEAALPSIDIDAYVLASVRRDPIATCGVPPYLDTVQYRGLIASPYFDARRLEILGDFTDDESPSIHPDTGTVTR